MNDPQRVDPFGDDLGLSEFKPVVVKKPKIEPAAIREVSEASGFPSRAPPKASKGGAQRRRRTGRNVQFNIKVTHETATLFTALADKHGLVFGELLEHALAAFQREKMR
jgi:hypothetical protein